MTGSSHPAAGSPASLPVPLFDTRRQFEAIRRDIMAAVEQVCASGRYIFGPECKELEDRVAGYCQVEHAVGCASGSDALLLALMALGIGPGDEVLMPSYTFFATASAAVRLGATPVFADIDPRSMNLDPRRAEEKITPRTKAIIPVHLFGQCAAMSELNAIAAKHNLPIVEDAAQAIGALDGGRPAGGLGHIGCFSFYPTKNLGGFGDGGLLTTRDAALAARLKLLRAHGMEPRYYHHLVGINSRLDSIQAAVLVVKLGHLERWTQLRRTNADRYRQLFADAGLDQVLGLPCEEPGKRHVWNQYVVRVPDGRRDALRAHLDTHKIGTEIYYPLPLHQQPCFANLGYGQGSLPETERAAAETVALPIFPELTVGEQQAVVRAVASFFGAHSSRQAPVARPKFLDQTSRHSA